MKVKEVTTEIEYKDIIDNCKIIFLNKFKKYGRSWVAFRPHSMTDQILIKIVRLRSLDSGVKCLVKDESILETLYAIYNYSIIRIMIEDNQELVIDPINHYEIIQESIFELMKIKNNDYGEVWRQMRYGSILDVIYSKLLRVIKQEKNDNEINLEEFKDIANYSIFASIFQLDL